MSRESFVLRLLRLSQQADMAHNLEGGESDDILGEMATKQRVPVEVLHSLRRLQDLVGIYPDDDTSNN